MAGRRALSSPLKVYGHPVSQPTRAVLWFCMLNDIEHELVVVDPASGGTREPEFRARFGGGTVPIIDDNGFTLGESNAILAYLADKHDADAWYPTRRDGGGDASQRAARIDEYLHWHHTNLRAISGDLFRPTLFTAILQRRYAAPPPPDSDAMKRVRKALRIVDAWLAERGGFVAGGSAPSIADLTAYCELDQLELCGFEQHYAAFDNVRAWMARMRALPHYDAAHEGLRKLAGYLAKVRAKSEADASGRGSGAAKL